MYSPKHVKQKQDKWLSMNSRDSYSEYIVNTHRLEQSYLNPYHLQVKRHHSHSCAFSITISLLQLDEDIYFNYGIKEKRYSFCRRSLGILKELYSSISTWDIEDIFWSWSPMEWHFQESITFILKIKNRLLILHVDLKRNTLQQKNTTSKKESKTNNY